MKSILVSVLGEDKPGLIDGLSEIILSYEGDWVESRMSSFEGKFAGIIARFASFSCAVLALLVAASVDGQASTAQVPMFDPEAYSV